MSLETEFNQEILIRQICNAQNFNCICVGKQENFDTLPEAISRHYAEILIKEVKYREGLIFGQIYLDAIKHMEVNNNAN